MKISKWLLGVILLSTSSGWAIPAFPGAEGYGSEAVGGRGGKVLLVTSLSGGIGAGSLGWALTQDYPRIIVFKVSGVIKVPQPLQITSPYLTVAGETAPGAGITIAQFAATANGGLRTAKSAHDFIIRFIRVRGGTGGDQGHVFCGSCVDGTVPTNFIIDHLSGSWSCDEAMDFCGAHDFTVQWSFINESINGCHPNGNHNYGPIHSYGQAGRWSFHHCLLAKHAQRFPLGEFEVEISSDDHRPEAL
jgi:pectate lyase